MKKQKITTPSSPSQSSKGSQPFFQRKGPDAFFGSDQVQLKPNNEGPTRSAFWGEASGSVPFFALPSIQPRLAPESIGVEQEGRGSAAASISRISENSINRESNGEETLPNWNSLELKSIQGELRRIGLYPRTRAGRSIAIDGIFGDSTRSGLVEAFGGDEWKSLDTVNIISRLKSAKPPGGAKGEHQLRYGEMFKDGILDITIGVGFDESNAHASEITAIEKALQARGFLEADDDFMQDIVASIYSQAGRAWDPSSFGRVFAKSSVLTYTPPAGAPRDIHAVVKLVTSPSGKEGGAAAGAFQEGTVQSDVSFYGGHGRYGTGPDFDRNMRYELFDSDGNLTRKIDDYTVLEEVLKKEGKPYGRGAWQQFLWRHRNGRIEVVGSNAGNVFLNTKNVHQGEFGSNLMYWNLNRKGGKGATPVTGPKGALSRGITASPERKYRLWVFDGCRTQDYLKSIRSTPGADAFSTDLMVSKRSLYWKDIGATLTAFLDSLISQNSAEKLIKDMDDVNTTKNPAGPGFRGSFKGNGFEDNPTNP